MSESVFPLKWCMKPYADGDIWQCWLDKDHPGTCVEANRDQALLRYKASTSESRLNSLRKSLEDLVEGLETVKSKGDVVVHPTYVIDRLRECLKEAE